MSQDGGRKELYAAAGRTSMQHIAVLVLLAGIGMFYLATLRAGQFWGDDFAMYITQARNIASGHWRGPTNYLYDPHFPELGPPAYPPLFPLLLAPLYARWGLDLTPMKVEVILLFLAALYLVFRLVSRQVPFGYAAVIVGALGCCPYFWEFKDNVLSDLPFLFFVMLALCVVSACERRAWKSGALAAGAGATVYLAFATRTAGVALLPCLLPGLAPRSRAARKNVLLALALAGSLMALHSRIFPGNRFYLDQLHSPWRAAAQNLVAASWHLRHLVFGLESSAAGWIFLLVAAALGAAGFLRRWRAGVSAPEVFALSYALLILPWGAYDSRMLIPLLPLGLLYVAVSLRGLPRRSRCLLSAALLLATAGGFLFRYSHIDFGPIREGLGEPSFLRICASLRARAAPGSVLVFAKPRILALLVERPVSGYHQPSSDQELWEYFDSIAARYVLVNRAFAADRQYLEPLLLRSPARAQPAGAEGEYHLYAIH